MNPDPDEPMDSQLLQLERELFSLSPAEAPRPFSARLDRRIVDVISPTTAAPSKTIAVEKRLRIVPFQWRRVALPAAAAVVVVVGWNGLESRSELWPALGLNSRFRQASPSQPSLITNTLSESASATGTTGYVLRTEPVFVSPNPATDASIPYSWQSAPSGAGTDSGTGAASPNGVVLTPVVFH